MKIILITGKYGVGKDTFADLLLKHLGNDAIKIKSYTTRGSRYKGEDTHEFFLPKSSLKRRIEIFEQLVLPTPKIVAYAYIDFNYYWTTKQQFDNEKYNIYVIDPHSIKSVCNYLKEEEICIIEVVRPVELILKSGVPEDRIYRHVTSFPEIDSSYYTIRVLNIMTLEKLDEIAENISRGIKNFFE